MSQWKGWALAVALVLSAAASDAGAVEDVGGTVVSVLSGDGGVGTVVKIDVGSSNWLKNGQYGWVQENGIPFAYIRVTSLGANDSTAEVTVNDSIYQVSVGQPIFFRFDRDALAQEWYDKGWDYYDSQGYGNALDCLDNAIALKPDNYYWYGIRGDCRLKTGDYDEAVNDMNIYIMHYPNDGWGYNIRGTAYNHLGETSSAVSDFKKSCDLGHDQGCNNYRRLIGTPSYIIVPR